MVQVHNPHKPQVLLIVNNNNRFTLVNLPPLFCPMELSSITKITTNFNMAEGFVQTCAMAELRFMFIMMQTF